MPAFGKSGTCLMCSLRSIRNLSDRKPSVTAGRVFHVNVNILDARPARSRSHRCLHSSHRVGLSFDPRLDSAVGQVLNPSRDALTGGDVFHEPPEPDTLDATADHEPACDAHEETPIIFRALSPPRRKPWRTPGLPETFWLSYQGFA